MHVCISKQFPSLGTPNFTAVVVKVGDDMGQDSATEAIHLGLNQPLFFFQYMEAHILTCTLRGKDKVLITTLLPKLISYIFFIM